MTGGGSGGAGVSRVGTGAGKGAGRACRARPRKVVYVRRSCIGFSVGFYKALKCSELCFIQPNPATRESDCRRG